MISKKEDWRFIVYAYIYTYACTSIPKKLLFLFLAVLIIHLRIYARQEEMKVKFKNNVLRATCLFYNFTCF